MSVSAADAGVGTAALPEGGRIDFAGLRESRRRRLFDAMSAAGLDVLLLGRAANIQFASGARQLWTAGLRPFGPGCIVVAGTGRVHLLSTWDEGVPDEIRHDDLFGLTWNPANLVTRVGAVPGLHGARRVGTDGVGPGTDQLLAALAPEAELVDANPVLRTARSVKTAEEVACIRTAAALAEAALTAMSASVAPGITERELVGVHSGRLAELGAPIPAWEAVACATPRHGPVRRRRLTSDRPVAAGELVALTACALYAGYEADVSRTVVCPGGGGPGDLLDRVATAQAGLIDACRPGATGADLVSAWGATGWSDPSDPGPEPLAWGVGLGMEPPVIGSGLGAMERLEEGMTLAVQAWLAEDGVGGALRADVLLVTAGGPEVLTRA